MNCEDSSPLISVVMPVYGDSQFLNQAVESILSQRLDDFEFLVVTESLSESAAETLAMHESDRVTQLETKGEGLVAALNHGLDAASGEFIARMDADDIAHHNRFGRQIEYLRRNEDLGVVGTAYQRIDDGGEHDGVVYGQESDLEIRWKTLLSSCIPHPTVMMRRKVLEANGLRYRPEYDAAEDYDLWVRMLEHTKAANIQEPLLSYRVGNEEKVSIRAGNRQRRIADQISHRAISRWFPEIGFGKSLVSDMRELIHHGGSEGIDKKPVGRRYLKLLSAFERKHGGSTGISNVRREATLNLLRALVRPPIETTDFQLVPALVPRNPRLPGQFARHLLSNPEVIRRRLPTT